MTEEQLIAWCQQRGMSGRQINETISAAWHLARAAVRNSELADDDLSRLLVIRALG